jgi:hypothetical protein
VVQTTHSTQISLECSLPFCRWVSSSSCWVHQMHVVSEVGIERVKLQCTGAMSREIFEHKVETPYHDNDLVLTPIISPQSGRQ